MAEEKKRNNERMDAEEQARLEAFLRDLDLSGFQTKDEPDMPLEFTGTVPVADETVRFDTKSIERQLSAELGMSVDEFRDLTDDPAAMTHLPNKAAGIERTAPLPDLAALGITPEEVEEIPPEPEAAAEPELSIEDQIARQVEEKVAAEEALAAAHRAEEERRQQAEAAAAVAPAAAGTIRMKRRRKKKGCLGSLLYVLFVIGSSLLLATVGWVCANEVLGLIKPDMTATVEIPEGYTISEVSNILEENGIIEYPWLFQFYAGFSDAEEKIDPGSYEIRADLDYRAIVYALRDSSSYRSVVKVTIPEGFTQEQIFARLAEKGVSTVEKLTEAARTADFGYVWLDGVDRESMGLEGFLYPDTYDFYVNENPKSALSKMLYNFDAKMTAEWRERAEELGYTVHEIAIIASLIEKESAGPDESPMIASVIHNRLNNWDNPLLNIDATIQYALPERKEQLTYADLEIDSPYNTYLYAGLPPGAIASPGYYSLKAALYPADSSYYYYALGEDGVHHFSKNAAEHEAFLNSLD